MYRKLLKTTPYILPAEQWESLKIMFSEKELIAYGDNVELIRVDLTNVDFPKKGYVGFLTRGFHRVLWEVKDLNIYQVK